MRTGRTLCNTVYWLALAIWLGVLIAAGVAAFATFTILPDLGLELESFRAYPSLEHGRIAAGKVMEPIFTFVDFVQIAAVTVVLIMVALQTWIFGYRVRRLFGALRVGSLVVAAGLFAFRAASLSPGMNHDLRAYWQAAEAGEREAAAAHRAAFDAAHPVASNLFSVTLSLVVVAVLSSPAALAEARSSAR